MFFMFNTSVKIYRSIVNNEKYFVRIYVIFFVFLKMSHWAVFITHQDKV